MYESKYAVPPFKSKVAANAAQSYLAGIEERDDSISSGSLHYHSEKHKRSPEQLKEQMAYKELLREKETLSAVDDAKLSRDHKRHFIVSRVLGHKLELPGAEEWQISR